MLVAGFFSLFFLLTGVLINKNC